MNPERFYRFVDVAYASPFDDTGRMPGTVRVELHIFEVARRTAKTVWLVPEGWVGFSGIEQRRMLIGARCRYACPTVEDARTSFIARKRRQIRILNGQISRATSALGDIERRYPEILSEAA